MPWYEPYDDVEHMGHGIRFALSQPGVTALPIVGDYTLLSTFIEAAEHFQPMSAEEQAQAIEEMAGQLSIFDLPKPPRD